jgi:hypothetical protein
MMRQQTKPFSPLVFAKRWVRRIILESLFILISLLVLATAGRKWKVWQRNSLALGYWSEGSDLDLTFYCANNSVFPPTLLVLRRLFRRFGEWTVYCGPDKEWASLANPIELARDPRLVKIFLHNPRPATPAECFAFWIRMVGSDLFLKVPAKVGTRAHKWNYHRERLEEAAGISCESAFPEFIAELGERLAPVPRESWVGHEPLLNLHKWFWPAYHSGMVSPMMFAGQKNAALLDVARAQVAWEVWGLLGQVRLGNNRSEVNRHIKLLAGLFPEMDPILPAAQGFEAYLSQMAGLA